MPLHTPIIDMDIRDEIIDHLKNKEERSLVWLAKKTGIKYSSLYSIMVQKTYDLSEENKAKINAVLKTNF